MKSNVHPDYNQITIKCACGQEFTTGSTRSKVEVEICSKCHPFFTGEMKYVDTMGRVEKFQAKQAKAQKSGKKSKKKGKAADPQDDTQPKTLKEMLKDQKEELEQKQSN